MASQQVLKALAGTPLWCFQGAHDSVVPVSLMDTSVDACARATRTPDAGPVRYTRLERGPHRDYAWQCSGVPDAPGHAAWVHAYYPPDRPAGDVPLYDWFLAHARPQEPPERDADDGAEAAAAKQPWFVDAAKPFHPITGAGNR